MGWGTKTKTRPPRKDEPCWQRCRASDAEPAGSVCWPRAGPNESTSALTPPPEEGGRLPRATGLHSTVNEPHPMGEMGNAVPSAPTMAPSLTGHLPHSPSRCSKRQETEAVPPIQPRINPAPDLGSRAWHQAIALSFFTLYLDVLGAILQLQSDSRQWKINAIASPPSASNKVCSGALSSL